MSFGVPSEEMAPEGGDRRKASQLYHDCRAGVKEDAWESLVHAVLSTLAFEQEIERKRLISIFIWDRLNGKRNETDSNSSEYEWDCGLRVIHLASQKLSAFDLHNVASQSIVFTDGAATHGSLCILLCCLALRKHPHPRIDERWKRWQSLVFETVRIYQHFGSEILGLAADLWVEHVLPACINVIEALPPDQALLLPLYACLVGTSTTLVRKECEQERSEGHDVANLLSELTKLLEAVRKVSGVSSFQVSDDAVWLHPWRQHCESKLETRERNEEVEYLQRKGDLGWWTCTAHRHENVAGVDTSWDAAGVAVLGVVTFDDRPQVYDPTYNWKMWFPHVKELFELSGSTDLPYLQQLPLTLLDALASSTPAGSLPTVRTNAKDPITPFVVFQQLSNRMVPDPGSTNEAEMEVSRERTQKIVGLMTQLLSLYSPPNQVSIVRRIIHDCPHTSLQAKFMDLLRPILFEASAEVSLWQYISSYTKEMDDFIEKNEKTLMRVEELVARVEVYVGAVTMIQLWCMVKKSFPKKIKADRLKYFHRALSTTLQKFSRDEVASVPDDYYRLFLLDGALRQIDRFIGGDFEALKNPDKAEGSEGTDMTERSTEMPKDAGHILPTSRDAGKAIVGDAMIFD